MLLALLGCTPETSSLPPTQAVSFTMGELSIETTSVGMTFLADGTPDCAEATTIGLFSTQGAWFTGFVFRSLVAGATSTSVETAVTWSETDPTSQSLRDATHEWAGMVRVDAWSETEATWGLDGTTCPIDGGECAPGLGSITIRGALGEGADFPADPDAFWTDPATGEALCRVDISAGPQGDSG